MKVTSPSLWVAARGNWRGTLVLMAVSWLVPVLVHLLPPIGVRENGVYFLPAFWAAFVAAYLYGATRGALVAVVTPAINLALTGLPLPMWLASMSLELVLFVVLSAWMLRRCRQAWLIAPFAWIPAKLLTLLVQWAVPAFHYHRNILENLRTSALSALPGLAILLLINLALVLLVPGEPDADWDQR
jgi:hypothetical protein